MNARKSEINLIYLPNFCTDSQICRNKYADKIKAISKVKQKAMIIKKFELMNGKYKLNKSWMLLTKTKICLRTFFFIFKRSEIIFWPGSVLIFFSEL